MKKSLPILFALALLAGCQSYSWKSSVPASRRTVTVPTFRNESTSVELGAATTRQVLREFQREGTFRLAPSDEAAIEVQGTVKSAETGSLDYNREISARAREHTFSAKAEVSLVDRRSGRVLVDNRTYSAETSFYSDTDIVTGRRNAIGRLAEDLARQIVDDVVGFKWDELEIEE